MTKVMPVFTERMYKPRARRSMTDRDMEFRTNLQMLPSYVTIRDSCRGVMRYTPRFANIPSRPGLQSTKMLSFTVTRDQPRHDRVH